MQLLATPGDIAAKVRFITLYYLIRCDAGLDVLKFVTTTSATMICPRFRRGLPKIHHDETRHIGYGVWFLREAARSEPGAAEVVRQTLRDLLPSVADTLKPPGEGARTCWA